jgi:hypothetical protein
MASEEAFTLDGLALNDGVTFAIDGNKGVDMTPPAARWEWVSGADVEGAALLRDPEHENRVVELPLIVVQQATMDLVLAQIAALRDKLAKASATQGGVALVWTPATSTKTATFDCLGGEVVGLPVSVTEGWIVRSPTVTLRLYCKPYWRGAEVTTSSTSSSTPFVTLEIPSVSGDVSALARVIVTDTATKTRRHVEWGLEGPATYDASTSLLVESDNLVTTGFSGSQTTSTGAYDVGGGNTAVSAPVQTTPSAMCGLGSLTHRGSFRVKARMKLPASTTSVRLAWRAGDDYMAYNPWVAGLAHIDSSTWQEVDLGIVTLRAPVLGTHSWTGQVETYDEVVGGIGGLAVIDYLVLVPVSDGYGVARAEYAYRPGAVFGQDSYTSTTAAAALNGRAAPLGGSWVTSGDATDLAFSDDLSRETVQTLRGDRHDGRQGRASRDVDTVERAGRDDLHGRWDGGDVRDAVGDRAVGRQQ